MGIGDVKMARQPAVTRSHKDVPVVSFTYGPSETASIAKLLAIENPDSCSEVALAQRVAEGLCPDAVTTMTEAMGGKRNWIVGPLVSEATFRRARKAGRLSKGPSERLYKFGSVLFAVARAYRGDWRRMEDFLTRAHPLLEGKSPSEMARSSTAGADAVLNLIRRAEAGIST